MTSPATIPALVGMVHLLPLPGSPGFAGSIEAVVDDAVSRARLLTEAGFRALMVENFGDSPFYADDVPDVTVASMTVCVAAIRRAVGATIGVNVLRNDALAAVAVAAATGAEFIRVNVLTGSMHTDQGPIVGRAAEVARQRAALAPAVAVWADVFVKHAAPPAGMTLEQSASDTWERGGADALIISGTGTGHAPDLERFSRLAAAVPGAPLVVGSGASPESLDRLAGLARHVIVGTALEEEGRPGAPLEPARVEAFRRAAEGAGLL